MTHIILDTDPGVDDALALFLALASPEVQLEAITTVSGNVSVALTTRNALALLELAGQTSIPVARGSSTPLVSQPVAATHVHGANGLGGVILPEPQLLPLQQHAVDIIIEKILAAPAEITLVCIGPLTNIALALKREPRIVQAVREVVIMGGALRVPGNVTPCAEFNIYADPHAAHIVLHSGWPIRLVPLDVTTKALLKRTRIADLATNGHPVTTFIQQATDHYFDVFGKARQLTSIQMHDPLCLAAVFRPDLLTWQDAYVDVELVGTLTYGETVGFFAHSGQSLPHPSNVSTAVDVNVESFIQCYLDRIGSTFS